ncbi:MAG TPA: hypothetical protein VGR70_12575, partial [Stellaceae bacterium]|nr:hypothetical protein [Stellaceae bacterium]
MPAAFRGDEKQPQQQRHQCAIGTADQRRFHGVDPAQPGRLRYRQHFAHEGLCTRFVLVCQLEKRFR